MINILLIDDNEVDRFITEKQLGFAGLEVNLFVAANGREGFDQLTRQYLETGHLPDVILVDRYMPLMDGLQFIEAFANLDMRGKENVKVFMLTSSIDPALWANDTRPMITGVIQKPFTHDMVTALGSRWLADVSPPQTTPGEQ